MCECLCRHGYYIGFGKRGPAIWFKNLMSQLLKYCQKENKTPPLHFLRSEQNKFQI